MGWQDISKGPLGRWVWGEWPAIVSDTGKVLSPRLVEPMIWGAPEGYVGHWLMRGRPTMGSGPSRWAEMGAAPPEEVEAAPSDFGTDGVERRAWIVLHEPGCSPQVKVPIPRNHAGIDEMLEALFTAMPDARATVAVLSYAGDLWVEDGRERLDVKESLKGPRKVLPGVARALEANLREPFRTN